MPPELPPLPQPLKHPRRLNTPDRASLLARYAEMEQHSQIILMVEIAVIVLALGWWFPRQDIAPVELSVWAAGIGFFGTFWPFVYQWFANKKRLEDLRPDAVFGSHTKDGLLALTERLCARLSVPRAQTQVFLTREKETNAFALRSELLPGMRLFNSVFLNRGIVHLLDEKELETVVAHELGHVWFFSPMLTRCYLIHALLAAAVGLAVVAAFPMAMGYSAGLPFVVLWATGRVTAFPWIRMGRGIEFLCDDLGARGGGWLPSFSTEIKMAMENETRMELLYQVMRAKQQGHLASLTDLIQVYDKALPFGSSADPTVQAQLKSLLDKAQKDNAGISLMGLYRYLSGSEHGADEAIEESLRELRLQSSLPLLPFDRRRFPTTSAGWTEALAGDLISEIEQLPTHVLVKTVHEVEDSASSHPNTSRRLLYLWRNRQHFDAR